MRSLRWCIALAALCCVARAACAETTAADGGRAREHIKDNSFFIEEAYNQDAGVVQHIFNWVTLWDLDDDGSRLFTFLYTIELPIFSRAHQLSLGFATFDGLDDGAGRGARPDDAGGFGDMAINYRYQLVDEDDRWPAIAPRATLILPTGDHDGGVGIGTVGYNANLPISKQRDPFAFHLNAGYTFVPDLTVPLDAGLESPGRDVHIYNFGLSAIWLATFDLNPFVELVAFIEDGVDDVGAPEHTTQVLVNPGVRYALYTDDRVQCVIGASLPIGLTSASPDIGVFGYLSIEHALGAIDW